MLPFRRHQRVESLIQEELNNLILKEVEFSGALVTVISVHVQKDLEYVDIGISVIPTARSGEALKILEKNRKYLQHLLLKKINIKPMPEIRFKIDYGIAKAAELEKKFIEIEKEEKNG